MIASRNHTQIKEMKSSSLTWLILILLLMSACSPSQGESHSADQVRIPAPLPKNTWIDLIPAEADLIISSVRHGLADQACLDESGNLKERFIQDADCNRIIYRSGGELGLPRQLFALDIETGSAYQITNADCSFINAQAITPFLIQTLAACEDTNQDGWISEADQPQLYKLELPSGNLNCLTCGSGLRAINNPDYSHIQKKIVFSAQIDPVFHNYLFTIDLDKNLTQLTFGQDYMDFDCAWSEDGSLIAFNRLPAPWFEHPAQIWLMAADGSQLQQITTGGPNPISESPHRRYPIGTDADADLSPDNSQIVFSRLKTGGENVPIGVWELVVVDLDTGQETVLDSSFANMVPEWKSGGIIFTRQIGGQDPMAVKQALYLYREGEFRALEAFPYDVFPIGAFGGSFIEWE